MARTAIPKFNPHQQPSLLQTTRLTPVTLKLPPAHSFQQFKLIHAWECRYDPNESLLNSKFDPANITPITKDVIPAWFKGNIESLPFMFPGLRFIVGACGTKFGKTFGCATRFAKEAWDNQGSLNWWVAPSYSQTEMAMEEVKKRLPDGLYHEQIAKHRITLFNPDGKVRSVMEFKSAENPDLLRGFPVDFFVIDEAARGMPWESFKSVMTTVTQTYGRGIIISTPNKRGWFYDIYQRGDKSKLLVGQEDPWSEWYSLRMPTWVNPTVDLKSVRDSKKNLADDEFRQEYAAEFINESAGVFRNIDACVKGLIVGNNGYGYYVSPYKAGHHYVLGIDLARLVDYTVLTVMDADTKEVVYWERFNKIDWQVQYWRIVSVAREYRALVCLDSTGLGDVVYSTLVAAGLSIEPYKIGGSTAKQQLVENLRVNIAQEKIYFPNIPQLIDELKRYEHDITDSGAVRYGAPEGYHDDCVISLALACWMTAKDPWIYRHYNSRGI